jgi:hypothetical protein
MPVKQVKLNLKPEIYKPLAEEAKRLRMPIAALVRVILADAILPEQGEDNTLISDEIISFSTNTDKYQTRTQDGTKIRTEDQTPNKSQTEQRKWLESETENIVYTVEETAAVVNNELLMDVARSLVESANALSEVAHSLSDSVRQLNQTTPAQPVAQAAAPKEHRQPRVDKDGELVLKLSDLLAEQKGAENLNQNLPTNLSHGVIVEDLSAPAQPVEPIQSRQTEQPVQKLRKITINL